MNNDDAKFEMTNDEFNFHNWNFIVVKINLHNGRTKQV